MVYLGFLSTMIVPYAGFELLAIWLEITAESSLDMAELENASPVEADKWFLSPCLSEYL